MRQLAATSGGVYHGGLGWATIHDKSAAAGCRRICERQAHEIQVFIETFAVAQSIRPGRVGALGQDDYEAGD